MAARTEQPEAPYVFEPKIARDNLHDLIDASALEAFTVDVDLQRMIILVSIPAE